MASIQQSLNQMFGSLAGLATAGSYMYRQSGAYQDVLAEKRAQKLESTAEDMGKSQRNLIRDLGRTQAEIEARGEDPDESITYQTQKKVIRETSTERENLLREAYRLSPSTKRLRNYTSVNKPGIAMDMFEKEQAESNAISRLETRSMTAREMLASLAERKDLLSAKERGQLTTMMGRHKEKGGIDI